MVPTSTLIRSIPENSTVHFAEEAQCSLHMMGNDPSVSLMNVDPSLALGGPSVDPSVDPLQCKHPLRRSPQLRPTPNLSRSNSYALSGIASQGTAMDPEFSDNLITALTEALEQHELQQVQQGWLENSFEIRCNAPESTAEWLQKVNGTMEARRVVGVLRRQHSGRRAS